MTDILLKARSSGWISIENNGGPNNLKIFKYLKAFSKCFDRVCFGTEHMPNFGTYAIKVDRLPRFKAHAAEHGLVADFGGQK